MNKLYLITYKTNPSFNSVTFHNYVKALHEKKWISDWWHYTDNAYIVASNQEVQKLYNAAAPGMKGIQYVLIIELNPNNRQGWLPPDAWKWLQKYK
jgi:hypothetical protein